MMIGIAPSVRSAERDTPRIAFRIPSQPLEGALLSLAQQARLQLAAVGDLDRAGRSGEVSGVMTIEAALQRLLAGSGYDFELRPDGVVTVYETRRPRAAARARVRTIVPAAVTNLAAVVVSARRRDERWIDVPMAVSVTDAADIEALGMANVTDALHLTPGVTAVDAGAAFTQVQIRGVSSSLGGNENGYYIDDAPFTGVSVPWQPDTRAFDLERIEVLRGPQGTLFGEGSMGGTVRIFTNAPELDRVAAAMQLGLSSTEGGGTGRSGKVMVNSPLVRDRLGLRVVATHEILPGWVDTPDGGRDINEQRITTERVRLRWSASDRWITDVGYLSSTTDAMGGDYGANDRLQSRLRLATRSRWRGKTLSSQYDLRASRLTLLRSDADLEHSLDGNITPTSILRGSIRIKTDNTELRWASTGGGPVDWLVGYAHRSARRFDELQVDVRASADAQSNRADAVFGEATLKPAGQPWSFNAGLRYFTEEVSTQAHIDGLDVHEQSSFHRVIPRLSISRQTSSQRMVYASIASGFRSGQIQPAESLLRARQVGIDVPIALAPDSLVSYELGFKQASADGRLRMQGALFHSRWHDLMVRVPIDDTYNALINSRGAAIRGAELELRYAPSNSFELSLGGTYTDARYAADVPATSIRRGTPVYNVPRISLAGSVRYAWAVKDMAASIAASARHHSRRETGLLGRSFGGDPITALSLRLGLESPWGWGWYVYGDNLSNEQGAVDGRTTFDQATRLHPRSFGLEVEYRY